MIRSHLRAGLVLACTLSLSACGGRGGDVYLGGTVVGNTKAGLVVTNSDGQRLEIPANVSEFHFPDLIDTNDKYDVKVVAWPDNTEGLNGAPGCQVVPGTGSGRAVYQVTTVRIVCTPKTYKLTVRVTGLKAAGLEIVNGTDRVSVPVSTANPTSVEMAPIAEGVAYGVAVLHTPDTQKCEVSNGTGKMGTEGKTVDVVCTP